LKCLSLKQPYADLLAKGKKTIELRNWNTRFRGEFLVHASRNLDLKACTFYNVDVHKVAKGGIIGKAYLYDVKKYGSVEGLLEDRDKHLLVNPESKSADRRCYGFLVRDAVRFEKFIPYSGKLGFFDVIDICV
jgi:hypothetical protein